MLVLRRMNSTRKRRRENNTQTKTMKSQQSTKYSLEKLEITPTTSFWFADIFMWNVFVGDDISLTFRALSAKRFVHCMLNII